MAKITAIGGSKITISITEENAVLKNWYAAYGFVHTGTKKESDAKYGEEDD